MRTTLLFALVAVAASCAGSHGGNEPPAPASAPATASASPDDGEPLNIDQLNAVIRDMKRAIEAKSFDAARALLVRAEKALANATDVTRSHPDFEDASEGVGKARARLDKAIEQDRVDRRKAAIDSLIERGTQQTERGQIILTELRNRMPTPGDSTNLDELIESLGSLDTEGRDYLSEPRYLEHATARDHFATTLVERRRQIEWQQRASALVGASIETALTAIDEAKKAGPEAQLAAWQSAHDALAACGLAVGTLETQGGFDAQVLVNTRLGTLAIGETKRRCLENADKIKTQLLRLAWQSRITTALQRANSALDTLRSASNAADKLAAADAALAALGVCSTGLAAVGSAPGNDPSAKFDFALGSGLSLAQATRACGKEKTRVGAQMAVLRRAVQAAAKAAAKAEKSKAKRGKGRKGG